MKYTLAVLVLLTGCLFLPRTPAVPARINTYKKAIARWGPEAQLIKYNAGEVMGIWSEGKKVVALGGEFSCMWHVTAKEQRQYKSRSLFNFGVIPHRRTLVFNANGTVMGGELVKMSGSSK